MDTVQHQLLPLIRPLSLHPCKITMLNHIKHHPMLLSGNYSETNLQVWEGNIMFFCIFLAYIFGEYPFFNVSQGVPVKFNSLSLDS